MTVSDFLQHWNLTENPFRGEEARSDAVFARMGGAPETPDDASLFHSEFEKILGDLRRPGSSVVFGEKGSGKTAIRLQLTRRIGEFNQQNPGAKLLMVGYDDLNGVLDRLHERLGGKSPLESLQKMRLVDHMDAILHAVVPRLVDAVMNPASSTRSASPESIDLGNDDRKPSKRLDRTGKLELLLLQAVYDRTDHAHVRTLHLRRTLRIGPPPGVLWGTLFLAAWPLMVVGAFIWVKYFAPASVPQEYAAWGLAVLAGIYAILAFKLVIWDRFRLLRTAHRIKRQLRVVSRGDVSYARSLRQFRSSLIDGANLPLSDSDESRYAMFERLKRVLRTFGYAGLVVVMDRVDEPTLVRGDPDRMKAVIWPLLNNKFLQQDGLGFKMLLPMELRHAVFRESSTFFQEARLDKQSLIEHLSWTGATLYDLCESRIAACMRPGAAAAPKLIDLFAEDVTRQDVVDALDRVHQPRDAFKLIYRCMTEHCAGVTRGQSEYKIARHVLTSVVKHENERVQQMFRGIRP
jgi:hypothetical protein